MLRSDLNIFIQDAISLLGSPGVAAASRVRRLRGEVTMDSADLALHKADGVLVGTAFGLPVFRDDALAAGKYVYFDAAGNTLLTNV